MAATASSGLAVAITSSGACSGSGSGSANITMTSATGTCSVFFNQAGNGNYSAAPPVTDTSSATTASTSISVTSVSPSSESFGQDAPVTITAVLSWSGSGSAPTAASVEHRRQRTEHLRSETPPATAERQHVDLHGNLHSHYQRCQWQLHGDRVVLGRQQFQQFDQLANQRLQHQRQGDRNHGRCVYAESVNLRLFGNVHCHGQHPERRRKGSSHTGEVTAGDQKRHLEREHGMQRIRVVGRSGNGDLQHVCPAAGADTVTATYAGTATTTEALATLASKSTQALWRSM